MPEPDPLMSIGVFATATLVSIKALRLYHEQGLLVPASVDSDTGYRSYRVSQLADAQVIKRLRDLDVPLAAVGEIVRARDPEVTRRVIAEHERVMRSRLDDLSYLVSELQHAANEPTLQTPAFVRSTPAQHALAITRTIDDPGHDAYAAFFEIAFRQLAEAFGRLRCQPVGPSGALYPPKVEGDSEVITAFTPVAEPQQLFDQPLADGIINVLLPQVTCAVLVHRGSYRTMGETYRQLGAWVATNATVADQPVRELYLVSTDEHGNLLPEDDLRTEIAWPIVHPLDHLPT
jgi:DNA-binding transcriptional MerR regulator/effector-binding domain-containing protein